ncbi:MAG: 2-oxoglutarate dehydrogenase E1 component, partial [uncultured Solirubrobacteraceae bacterium]
RRHRPPDLGRDGRASSATQGGARRHERRATHRRLPARPHPLSRCDHRRAGRGAARAQRLPPAHPRRLHGGAQARQAARAPRRDARQRGRHRLGTGRGARLRLAAARGHAGAPDRPGRRARHLLPAPPRPARLQDRAAHRADPGAAGRDRADGAAQLPALGDRLPRLRVRLCDRGARVARALGGPVRRLRQQRAGDHRSVHRLGAGQVGADEPAHAAPPPRLRGLGTRALVGAPGAIPAAVGRRQPARRLAHHAGAVLPPPAPAGEGREAPSAGDHDPQVAAAPSAGDFSHRAPLGVAVLPRARRAAHRRGQGPAARAVHRQDLLRPQEPRHSRGQRARRDQPRRAPVSLPAGPDRGRARPLSQPARSPLGAGGAAQHGRARAHDAAPAADPAARSGLRLRRPARAGVDRRGLSGGPHERAEPHHPHGAGRLGVGEPEPRQGAGRAL